MIGFMFPAEVDEGDVEKYMNGLRRAQMDLDLEPERYKHYYITASLEGDCNALDPASCFLRFLSPSMQQLQQCALVDRTPYTLHWESLGRRSFASWSCGNHRLEGDAAAVAHEQPISMVARCPLYSEATKSLRRTSDAPGQKRCLSQRASIAPSSVQSMLASNPSLRPSPKS